ncbi:DUF5602 domain-containing protein [Microvirga sp. STR05]|uniref:DUF5602 domain-containing protein n=1 Tax=Hymenobacter duratus TaxID=2771356 RepID=A0ABR8JIJ2_9BACT|nr:DUF5602 domain-containing protein [Hymenobacter duratus]MBD2715172.1 DUF5602 domain-containing protein [Hymenobacter duratus]MBR7950079.1 DUF5602 domain-containing protein [Microvirga sp. STR05]
MKTNLPSYRPVWSRLLLLLAVGLPLVVACDDDDDSPRQPSISYGPTVQVGSGSARSFVAADADGKPTEIGIALTEAGLTGLPATPVTGIMYELALPTGDATARLPFDHLSFDWNPSGHEPAGVYTVPHFDAHFYMIPSSVQHAIILDDPKGDILPAPNKLPTGYVTAPNVAPGRTVPMMGRHWSDPSSPEYQPGGSFSHTFIYGSYDGHVSFLEPMFTKALLVPAVAVQQAIKQPQVYEAAGKYYPATYTIRYDAATREYIISLKDMTLR